jgi:hypothetical protein
MNLKGRLEKLEAVEADAWPCCVLTPQIYFQHAVQGVCIRTGREICDFQRQLQEKGEDNFRRFVPPVPTAEELEGLADLSQLKPPE